MTTQTIPTTTTADAADVKVYRIPEANLSSLTFRITKMNRRAAKLGLSPITVTTVGEDFDLLVRSTIDGEARWSLIARLPGESVADAQARHSAGRPAYMSPVTYSQRHIILLTVTGSLPRIADWSMMAAISHDAAGNILNTVPGTSVPLPAHYRSATTICEHCNTARRRNDTYVLYNDVTSAWKQVGRNCLADFLRAGDASAWADAAELLASLDSSVSEFEDEGGDSFGRQGEEYWATLDVLAQVAACIRTDGWCSSTEAKNDFTGQKQSTVAYAMQFFSPQWVAKLPAANRAAYVVTPADTTAASAAITWAQSLPSDVTNDYLWNIRVISHRDSIRRRETGLAGSIIAAYNRHQERELARQYEKATSLNEYFGTVGVRAVYTLTVMKAQSIETQYGATTVYIFRDSAGRAAKWFSSGSASTSLSIGSTYTIRATVKDHAQYMSQLQTVLSRCDVVANLTALAECAAGRHEEAYSIYNGPMCHHCTVCGEVLSEPLTLASVPAYTAPVWA